MFKKKKVGRLAAGLFAGSLVGAAIGVLAAPKTGKETRTMIRVQSEDCISSLVKHYNKQMGRQSAPATKDKAGTPG